MAFQEMVNFGLHSKRSPWNATNFYEMFGVSRDGAKDLDDFEFHQIITEAWAKRLVDIPTVSSLYFLEPNGSSPQPPWLGWIRRDLGVLFRDYPFGFGKVRNT